MARPITPAIDRALLNIAVTPWGCWEYQGSLNRGGYGQIGEGRAVKWLVHRLVYTHEVAPIPDDLTLDHLCANTRCCNPAHLEPVTLAENTRRQWANEHTHPFRNWVARTHCRHGHEFTPSNTRHYRGRRHCRACHAKYMRNHKKES